MKVVAEWPPLINTACGLLNDTYQLGLLTWGAIHNYVSHDNNVDLPSPLQEDVNSLPEPVINLVGMHRSEMGRLVL